MKYIDTLDIDLSDIDVTDRLRKVDENKAQGFAESILKVGQKTPIEVITQTKGKPYRLIAGGHRYRAHEIAGLKSIRAELKEPETSTPDYEAKLHEIDENLIRNELSPLERSIFLGKRQEVYEAMHPKTRKGANGGRGGKKNESEIVSFSKNSAEAIGIGERTIQRATMIFKALSPELIERIQGTPLAQKEGELHNLARQDPKLRLKIVEAYLAEDDPASSIAVAANRIYGKPNNQPNPVDQAYQQLIVKFRNAPKEAKTAFLEHLMEVGAISAFDKDQLA